ncbi:MAG: efflux RND transporter periplasmic adaptor subunit [Pseudomonadota bacterium]
MIRKLKFVGSVFGLALGFAVLIMVMGALRPEVESQTPTSAAPIAFVQDVDYGPMNLTVQTQGEVAPRREIQLAAQIAGRIDNVSPSFANGGVFKKGELLLSVEDADYRLAVTRARANVAQSEQQLAVEEAEGALAARDFEELSGTSTGASASLLTLRKPQLAAARANLEAARADLEDALLALSRTKITAPFDGRVRSINANIGQYVTPGQNLGQVFSTNVAEIRLPLTDEDLAKLQLPFAFEATNDDAPQVKLSASAAGVEREWIGRIARVDAAIDATTRQISAIAEVDDPYGAGSDNGFPLAFGLFVSAEILGPTIEQGTTIPYVSMQNNGSVFVVDDNDQLRAKAPKIIAQTGEGYIAIAGLEPGDRLVISPVPLGEGEAVRPLYSNGDNASRVLVEADTGDAASAIAPTGANL